MAAPSLSTQQIRKIETLIRVWQSKLTWHHLVDRIEIELNIKTTRQTLNTYNSIKRAYDIKKQEFRGKPTPEFIKFTKSDLEAYRRITNLEAENKILQQQVSSQLAFIRQIAIQSSNNPLLTQLLNKVKQDLDKK